jgi:hypothetical protein
MIGYELREPQYRRRSMQNEAPRQEGLDHGGAPAPVEQDPEP